MASFLDRFRPWAVSGFALFLLIMWGNRIWLAWTNDEDTVAEKMLWSTPITVFVVGAVVILAAMYAGRAGSPTFARGVALFAAAAVLYWIIRMGFILTGDHEIGFVVVHGLLALATAIAAAGAVRALGFGGRADGAAAPRSSP